MAPVIAGVGTVNGSAANTLSITLDKPAGVADGDLLIAFIADQSTAMTGPHTAAGWTVQGPAFEASNATHRVLDVLTFPVTSAAGLPATWTFTGAGTTGSRTVGYIVRVTGMDLSSIYDVSSARANTGTPGTAAAVTTTRDNELLLCVYCMNFSSPNDHTLTTTPAGMTRAAFGINPSTSTTVARTTLEVWSKVQATAGTSGSFSIGASTAGAGQQYLIGFKAVAVTTATAAASLPVVTAAATGTQTDPAAVSVSVPRLSAAASGSAMNPASLLAAQLPLLTAAVGFQVANQLRVFGSSVKAFQINRLRLLGSRGQAGSSQNSLRILGSHGLSAQINRLLVVGSRGRSGSSQNSLRIFGSRGSAVQINRLRVLGSYTQTGLPLAVAPAGAEVEPFDSVVLTASPAAGYTVTWATASGKASIQVLDATTAKVTPGLNTGRDPVTVTISAVARKAGNPDAAVVVDLLVWAVALYTVDANLNLVPQPVYNLV